jgi:hypothetical protein
MWLELGIGCGIQSKEEPSSNYLIGFSSLILTGRSVTLDSVCYGTMSVSQFGYIVSKNNLVYGK